MADPNSRDPYTRQQFRLIRIPQDGERLEALKRWARQHLRRAQTVYGVMGASAKWEELPDSDGLMSFVLCYVWSTGDVLAYAQRTNRTYHELRLEAVQEGFTSMDSSEGEALFVELPYNLHE